MKKERRKPIMMLEKRKIEVVPYNPKWKDEFQKQ